MTAGLEVFSWRDFTGNIAHTRVWVADDTAAIGIQDVLQSVSNAHWCASRGPEIVLDDRGVGVADVYQDAEDKIRWSFVASDTTLHAYTTPAPIASLLLNDGVSVDPTNATVMAFVAAIIAHASTPGGATITDFLGARRTRLRNRHYPRIVVTP